MASIATTEARLDYHDLRFYGKLDSGSVTPNRGYLEVGNSPTVRLRPSVFEGRELGAESLEAVKVQ